MPLYGENDRRKRIRDEMERIRRCREEGDSADACERLCALPVIATPYDDEAEEVGRLFLDFGFPEMAGRFWYFHESPTPEMSVAINRFEESCAGNPRIISDALGAVWPSLEDGSPAGLRQSHLDRDVADLRRRFDYEFASHPRWIDRLWLVGCAGVAFVVLFVLSVGVIFIASWFKEGL